MLEPEHLEALITSPGKKDRNRFEKLLDWFRAVFARLKGK